MICPTDPPKKKKKKEKIPKKIPSEGHPRARTLVELKEKFPDQFFYNMQINVGTPLFRSMCQAQNTDTHALNQLGVSQILRHCDAISLLINTLGIHLEPGCKSHGQIIYYRTAKSVPKTSASFALFSDDFL